MADTYDFNIDQGATHNFTLTYKDSNGDPIDLSDYTPQMDVRTGFKNDVGSTLLFSLVSGDGIDTADAVNGVLTVQINATRSGLMVENIYRYDVEVDDSGTVIRLVQGKISVKPEVTD